jgi:hypothetical protein
MYVLQDAASNRPSQSPLQIPASLPLTNAHLNHGNPNALRLFLPPDSLSHSVEPRLSANPSRQPLEKGLSINTGNTTLASVNASASTITPVASQSLPPAAPQHFPSTDSQYHPPPGPPAHIEATSSERHDLRAMLLPPSTEENTQHNNEEQQPTPPPHHGQQVVKAPAPGVPDTFDMSHTGISLLPAPAANASTSTRIDFMHQQLDSLGVEAEALPGLILMGSGVQERLQGGAVSFFFVVLQIVRCKWMYAL